jgi:hypothetical protein
MYPCSTCDRHLRESDRVCPFCGTVQETVTSPSLGPVVLTIAMLGAVACAKDPGSAETTAGTTTSMTTTTATESEDEESSGGTESTPGDGDGDGDTTNETLSTSGSFYAGPPTDEVWSTECDPFAQDCPEGEKCVPYASTGGFFDANKCVPIIGDGQPGEPCTYGGVVESTDDCDADSFCWADGETGVCTAFCQGTPDAPSCAMGFHCLIDHDGSVNLCMAECNPLLQDCDQGFGCYWDAGYFGCMEASENIPVGEPCESSNACALGLQCVDGTQLPECAGDSCCASFCDVSAPMCPQMGTECVAFYEQEPPMGYENVGLCTLPPGP